MALLHYSSLIITQWRQWSEGSGSIVIHNNKYDQVGRPADMWAIGVILYMLVTGGVSPFYAGNRIRTMMRLVGWINGNFSTHVSQSSISDLSMLHTTWTLNKLRKHPSQQGILSPASWGRGPAAGCLPRSVWSMCGWGAAGWSTNLRWWSWRPSGWSSAWQEEDGTGHLMPFRLVVMAW